MNDIKGLGVDGHWIGIRDGDPRAIALYRRHYSYIQRKRCRPSRLVGGSAHILLLTVDGLAVFGWLERLREEVFTNESAERGILNTIFRNEGPVQSSDLIREAEELAWGRWPGQRLFTYVWDIKVRSPNPGYSYKSAGWHPCGRNKDGRLTILEKYPEVRQ